MLDDARKQRRHYFRLAHLSFGVQDFTHHQGDVQQRRWNRRKPLKRFMTIEGRAALITATTAALFGSMLVASPANAAVASPAAATVVTGPTVQALFDATDRIEDRFDGALARRAGVDAATVDSYATGFAATGGIVQNAAVDPGQAEKLRAAGGDIRACVGKNRSDYTGLQLNVYLSSCNTNRVIALLGGGTAVVSSLAAILGVTGLGAAACAALAGLLAVAGAFLGNCASNGRGTVIHNIPPSSITWCNSQ